MRRSYLDSDKGQTKENIGPGSHRPKDLDDYPIIAENLGQELNRMHYDAWRSKAGDAKKSQSLSHPLWLTIQLMPKSRCPSYTWITMLMVDQANWRKGRVTRVVQ